MASCFIVSSSCNTARRFTSPHIVTLQPGDIASRFVETSSCLHCQSFFRCQYVVFPSHHLTLPHPHRAIHHSNPGSPRPSISLHCQISPARRSRLLAAGIDIMSKLASVSISLPPSLNPYISLASPFSLCSLAPSSSYTCLASLQHWCLFHR